MKLVFARHGETDYNAKGLIQGRVDRSLNEKGREQAKVLAQDIDESGTEYEAIFTSDLKRAFETARIVAEQLGQEVIVDERLRERDYGDLAGSTWEDVKERTGKDMKVIDHKQEYDYTPYGGESVEDVRERLEDFLEYLQKNYEGPILAIAHGGIVRLMHHLHSDEEVSHIPNSSTHEFDL